MHVISFHNGTTYQRKGHETDSSGDGNLDLDTWLDRHRSDLLDGLSWAGKINEPLVDLELVSVPGLGAFTAGGLSGSDLQDLGGHPDRSLNTELLILGSVDQIRADLFQSLDILACQGDPDLVRFRGGHSCLVILFGVIFGDVTHPGC